MTSCWWLCCLSPILKKCTSVIVGERTDYVSSMFYCFWFFVKCVDDKKSPVRTAYFKETIVPTSRGRVGTVVTAEPLIDACVSSCLWPTAGETVLAEGQSGTRAYVWHTLSLTVEVSKGLFFTAWTEPTDANILQAASQPVYRPSVLGRYRQRGDALKVPYHKKHVFSALNICKLVLPEPANSLNEENKQVLHGLCSPPTGNTALLQAVQIQLL